jgi:hypothetical protein
MVPPVSCVLVRIQYVSTGYRSLPSYPCERKAPASLLHTHGELSSLESVNVQTTLSVRNIDRTNDTIMLVDLCNNSYITSILQVSA